jgi:hypothetical protein
MVMLEAGYWKLDGGVSDSSLQHQASRRYAPACDRRPIMNRTEIEIALNRDRAWLIETFAAEAGR